MDITQTVLLSIIIVLTIFLVILGCQAYFALKDLRKTLRKTNRLLDDADDIVAQVRKPVDSLSSILSALTAGAGIAHLLKDGKKNNPKK